MTGYPICIYRGWLVVVAYWCSSCIKETSLLRHFNHNTYQEDFVYFVGLLCICTLQQGWDRCYIHKLILEGTRRAKNPKPIALPSNDKNILKDTLFLHFQFHKDSIPRQQVRAEFEEILGSIYKEELGIT